MILALALAAALSPEPLVCPASVSVGADHQLVRPGWSMGLMPGHRRPRPGKHALSNISLAEGPPAEMGFLAPDRSDTGPGGLVNRWSLGPSKLGFWLICEYESSGANLNVRLAPEIGQCAIRYDAKAHVLTDGRALSCGPADPRQ